jgi:peptidoglycan/LPS O-acetylase OafA/YrhL
MRAAVISSRQVGSSAAKHDDDADDIEPHADGRGHIPILDPLRGIAAGGVAWYHLTNLVNLPEGWLKASGSNGFLGVEMFFVISGFIIPYSMIRGGYRLRSDWGRFIAKRVLRLDPPYLASVVLAAALLVIMPHVPWFGSPQPHLSARWLLFHLAYVSGILGWGWLNPVYWTLGVEFQYYLAISLLFPLIMSESASRRFATLVVLCALALVDTRDALLPRHLALFALGIATCQFRTGRLRLRSYLACLVAITVIAVVVKGPLRAAAGLGSALAIAFMPTRTFPRPLVALGTISYSLYLLHFLVGGTAVELLLPVDASYPAKLLMLGTATGLTLIASVSLHQAVEVPARRWSARIRYRRTALTASAAPIPLTAQWKGR